MSSWADVAAAAPELADRVRQLFDSRRHKTLATLRADGSPRVSGIECEFAAGDLRFGSMPGSLKGQDLRRDPRLVLHASSDDPSDEDPGAWPGDAKIAGRARLVAVEGDAAADGFVVDVSEVVLTTVDAVAQRLVVESWHPEAGYRRRDRA